MMRICLISLFMVACLISSGWKPVPDEKYSSMLAFLKEYLAIKYSGHQFEDFLYVAAKQQKMYHIKENRVIAVYPVSTAKNGIGSILGSNCTPAGLHHVKEKVGDGIPMAGILREKTYTGQQAVIRETPTTHSDDQITTRLFHLDGLEPGVNKGPGFDSYNRGIMIHGTPDEGLIGTPASHGCVRMKNEDVLQLYDLINPGTYVVILNN